MNQLLIVFEYWEYGGDGGEDVAKRFEAEQLLSFLPAVRIGWATRGSFRFRRGTQPLRTLQCWHIAWLGVVHPECMDSVWKCQCMSMYRFYFCRCLTAKLHCFAREIVHAQWGASSELKAFRASCELWQRGEAATTIQHRWSMEWYWMLGLSWIVPVFTLPMIGRRVPPDHNLPVV